MLLWKAFAAMLRIIVKAILNSNVGELTGRFLGRSTINFKTQPHRLSAVTEKYYTTSCCLATGFSGKSVILTVRCC